MGFLLYFPSKFREFHSFSRSFWDIPCSQQGNTPMYSFLIFIHSRCSIALLTLGIALPSHLKTRKDYYECCCCKYSSSVTSKNSKAVGKNSDWRPTAYKIEETRLRRTGLYVPPSKKPQASEAPKQVLPHHHEPSLEAIHQEPSQPPAICPIVSHRILGDTAAVCL